ncbi:DUF1295 domain-containing protein [Pseudonocardia sp. WMMC193]|uniref:DUF1295 domain-containing protein n=1 Tax=Pseudonocardia sp. WMMC193 TaxID=2911965 RepID=UPI001F397C3D|nr:DUF1295 domain-containing protein [Pseudonocardia sp. WMMC193]MCF7550120.1 DUF1295 domain-containing protein [Pseudonocardia sp. WMMC193]
MSFPWGAFLTNLWITAVAVLLVMAAALAVAYVRKRHDGIDVVWGSGFGVIAIVTLVAAQGSGDAWRQWLITALTVVWGARLAIHIGRRNHGQPEDRRYVELMKEARGNPWLHAFRKVYLVQGVVMWVVSLPVQVGQYGWSAPPPHGFASGVWPTVVTVLGVLVWAVGMFFETVGDAQLATFKADPANKGRVMDRGLWRYTRHPNYFGDACVWWGLALLALHQPAGLIGVLGAAAITVNLAKGTGATLLESTIGERRPGYVDYVKRTSGFIPLPPKKKVPMTGDRA